MVRMAFCIIVRNAAGYLKENLATLSRFGQSCDDYRLFFVENDSTDETVTILKEFACHAPLFGKHLHLGEQHSTELCGPNDGYNCNKRTQRLAMLRQTCLELALDWEECDFVTMLDIDFLGIDSQEFQRAVELIEDAESVDCVSAMSVTAGDKLCPYDIGAVDPWEKLQELRLAVDSIPVASAFGGFTIYRRKSIDRYGVKYSEKCDGIEHKNFNLQFPNLKLILPWFRPVFEGSCQTEVRLPFTYQLPPRTSERKRKSTMRWVKLAVFVVVLIAFLSAVWQGRS